MSQKRLKTIERDLDGLLVEVECAADSLKELQKSDTSDFKIDGNFIDKFEDVRDSLHAAKIAENRLFKKIKDYIKSLEKNKKDTEISV